ncbi:MAG TPA: GNAT family N-acetyltransferase [Pyrinomonadaceae bacterium]|nr:GNAT family N-acetyltransferase [Pyrinomonadaceae bacterium]
MPLENTDLRITIREGFYLSGPQLTDKPALLEHLHSKDVYNTTLTIPHPYSEADADWWLQRRVAHNKKQGKPVSFAIRDVTSNLIGVVSADNLELGMTHKAEIGYWLARDYWGKGIMTAAVKAYVRYAFDELGLLKLLAHTFESNTGSIRVLERSGFKLEGRLRKHFRKDGNLLDARIYGLLEEDLLK